MMSLLGAKTKQFFSMHQLIRPLSYEVINFLLLNAITLEIWHARRLKMRKFTLNINYLIKELLKMELAQDNCIKK